MKTPAAISLVPLVLAIAALSSLAAAQAGPTDPQIAGIVVAANDIDINYAKLALSKSKNSEVRAFAQQMKDDHTALQKAVGDLAAKLNLKPEDSDTSKSLKSGAAAEMNKLQALKGKEFDREYMNNEVAYHKVVINATNNVLIPNAQNAELKSALSGAAPLFQGHLEHAEKVESKLSGGSAGK